MFNIGLGEMLFIAVLALLALGPDRLPKIMRQLGEIVYQIRIVVEQFNSQFADELKPIREIQSLATELNPMRTIGNAIEPSSQPQPTIAPPVAPSLPPAAPAASPFAGLGEAHPMTQISRQMATKPGPVAATPPVLPADADATNPTGDAANTSAGADLP